MTTKDPSFPGNDDDARERKSVVAEIIRDLWPHRMSGAAAQIIDGYYLRLAEDSTYQPRHRAGIE